MSKSNVEESETSFYTKSGLIVFLPVVAYIVFGATMYQWLEKFSVVNSYYFVVITLSTIGYGDVVPTTDAGKIFTIFFIIFGLALFSSLIATIVARSKARRERRQEKRASKA